MSEMKVALKGLTCANCAGKIEDTLSKLSETQEVSINLLRQDPQRVKENIKKKFQEEKLVLVDEVVKLDREFRDPALEVGEIARSLRITPNHLQKLIRRETGRSFRELLLERRIKEAQVYLKLHRHLSVTRIASLCGFHDSNYFSTCFRRIAGCSPREYRAATVGTASDATR